MRILVDYRPALRHRTGVGEYAHELVRALARADGNIVKASEMLGVSRPTLYDLMNRLAVKVDREAKGTT